MRDEQEQPKQQPRRVTQRLVVPRDVIEMFGCQILLWVDSSKIDLDRHVPLEAYSRPVETVRQVER